MDVPKQLAGELEIIVISKMLNRAIRVVNENGDDVQMHMYVDTAAPSY